MLFDPAWGNYGMAVGSAIASVYGGVADRQKLQLYKPTPRTDTIQVSADEQLMQCYTLVNRLRRDQAGDSADARDLMLAALEQYPEEWLLRIEMLECAPEDLKARVRQELSTLEARGHGLADLGAFGLAA